MSSFRDALATTEVVPEGCAEVLVHLRHEPRSRLDLAGAG
jgi:hypothetical protein